MSEATSPDDSAEKPTIGRPSDYRDEYAEVVENLVLANQVVTDAELAQLFDVSESTIRNWKKQHRAFLLATKKVTALKIARLTGRFMDRALGMTVREQKLTKDGDIITLETELPPDTGAAIFALKNLAGWRDRSETLNVDVKVDLIEYAKEYARRIGPEAAHRFLLDHGYSAERIPALLELQAARVDDSDE